MCLFDRFVAERQECPKRGPQKPRKSDLQRCRQISTAASGDSAAAPAAAITNNDTATTAAAAYAVDTLSADNNATAASTGVNLYRKKMKSKSDWVRVMTNKYGMELIECHRGTNRVEAYHKHLVPYVRSRNFGVKMADCLLAEKRHRHNQNLREATGRLSQT